MKITLEHSDPNILDYFEQVTGWLNLEEKLDEINAEYLRTTQAFVHLDVLCRICDGAAIHPITNEPCDHHGGTFNRVHVFNSDWIIAQKGGFAILPDEGLIKRAHEADLTIPAHILEMIIENEVIPLSNRTLVVVDELVGSKFIEHVFRLITEMQGFWNPDFGPDNVEVDPYLFPKVIVE